MSTGDVMNLTLLRSLLVFGVFALMAALWVARDYLASVGSAPPPAKHPSGPDVWASFWSAFRYYLSWAAVTPGILWLGRRVAFTRHRWRWPLVFHLLVALAAGGPFFVLTLLIGAACGFGLPPMAVLVDWWGQILLMQTFAVVPVYALVLGLGAALQVHRDYQTKQLQAVELQRSLAATQLDALRMKSQPQFLLDTLEWLGSLARCGDTEAVSQVVEHLGRLLRLSMDTSGRRFVTLDEELALLAEYLSIEAIRFGDRLHVVRRIDPDARKAMVPTLILQPLVEHAITRDSSRVLEPGVVEIMVRREGDDLRIVVHDDGPGLPPGWTLASSAGRGLRDVEERRLAMYAGDSEFSVSNGEPSGVTAQLRLPFVEDRARGNEG